MTVCGAELRGRVLHPGRATGEVLRLTEPLSFWGGVGEDGTVIDVHHPQRGLSLTGRILVMDSGRGSSSSAAVLAERLRAGSAPAAIVLGACDSILVVGALVAAELYDVHLPIIELDPGLLDLIEGAVNVDASFESGATLVPTGGGVRR